MSTLQAITTTGGYTVLGEAAVRQLQASLRGELLLPSDDRYEETRKVWNGMIDKRPALIARCTGVADIIDAVNFARTNELLVSVRGGGHNITGNAVCEGGLMIDLSPMKSVRVDPVGRTARAEAGLTWGEYNRETQAFGLASTGGVVSTTGIAGLTLGGGLGWLHGKHGLSCDNLLSADIVTAEGQFLTASATEHPDLFWGLRGGGGNFGVVTSFEYRLHPLHDVLAGVLVHPLERAGEVLRFARDFARAAPDELAVYLALGAAPDGRPSALVIPCYGGPDATGCGSRAGVYTLLVLARWTEPADDETNVRWARAAWAAMQPNAAEAVYVNYLEAGLEGAERVRSAYGANYARLAALKAK